MRTKQLEIPKDILDIKDPVEKRRRIHEMAQKAKVDLTLPHHIEHDISKRSVVVEQNRF